MPSAVARPIPEAFPVAPPPASILKDIGVTDPEREEGPVPALFVAVTVNV